MMSKLPKLLALVGPTASGKTSLAVELAKKFDGEVISADSRLVYKGMDIATAKPSRDECHGEPCRMTGQHYLVEGIPHHMIDLINPDETFTLADFKDKAIAAIKDTLDRGKLPILVGGTGLYIQSVVDNLKIPRVAPNKELRIKLGSLSEKELLDQLKEKDPEYFEKIGPNPRYAVRALEVIEATGKKFSQVQGKGEPLFDTLLIGLDVPKDILDERIDKRFDEMLTTGLLDEVRGLVEKYDPSLPSMSGIGYKEFSDHLEGNISLLEATQKAKIRSHQYAKRQKTWFKRDERIRWFKGKKDVLSTVENWLI